MARSGSFSISRARLWQADFTPEDEEDDLFGGGIAVAEGKVFVRRDRVAEREALAALPRHGFTPPRGATLDGEGRDDSPAAQVVEDIRKAGGDAVACYEDIASWDGGWVNKYTPKPGANPDHLVGKEINLKK